MMSDSIFERESTFQFPSWRAVGRDACEQRQRDALTAELQASFGCLAREEALREEKRDYRSVKSRWLRNSSTGLSTA
jgi:hypothetical protein